MPETAWPALDQLKALSHDMVVTVLLPVSPRVGMAIQGQLQADNRVPKIPVYPRLRPLIPGQTHPGRCADELCLCVGLLCIGQFSCIAREQPDGVRDLSSGHGGWATREFLEHCNVPVLVLDVVALKYHPPLECLAGVAIGELCIRLGAQGKHATNVRLTSLVGDLLTLLHSGEVPDTNCL